MLTSPARLCRPCRLAGPAHAAATAGLAIQEGEIPRETDCLLEGDGFEPSVPPRVRAKSLIGPHDSHHIMRLKTIWPDERNGIGLWHPWYAWTNAVQIS